MTCYMHSTCRSPAKKVWEVTEEDLIRWLLASGAPPPDATSGAKKALGVRHKAIPLGATPSPSAAAAPTSTPM